MTNAVLVLMATVTWNVNQSKIWKDSGEYMVWRANVDIMYTILACIDGVPERAVRQAEAIADLPGTPEDISVFLLHVFEENPKGASASQVQSVRRAVKILEDVGIAHEIIEESGNPSEEIIKAARETNVDALCVATKHRSPAGKAVFGSVAQNVLLGVGRPVITVPEK